MAETQTGFMAISPQIPTGPLARRKVIRGPDGTPTVVYIDNNTGQELSSLDGYKVIESSNYLDLDTLGLNPVEATAPKETAAQKTIQSVRPKEGNGDTGLASNSESSSRNPSNNFGYIDKPGWSKLAGAIPGPLGMAGKAANLAVNANNTAAIDSARGMMGVPDQTFGQNTKSVIKDTHGQVADVNINNNQYSVGLEAMSPDGRTNLTPNEARQRALATGGIVLSSPAETSANKQAFQAEFNKPTGIFSRITTSIGSFIDDMFGPDENDFASAPNNSSNSGSRFSPTSGGFADMLNGTNSTPTSGVNSSGNRASGAGPMSGSNTKTSVGRDLSPAASDAIDRGEGGLY